MESTEGFRFQADWFSWKIPSWENLFKRIAWDSTTPKTIVEIGSFEGRSAVWMLQNLIAAPGSALHCIDPYAAYREIRDRDFEAIRQNFLHNVNLTGKGDIVTLHRGQSFDKLVEIYATGIRADLIYIDGDHYAEAALADLVLSYKIAKPGALIICDDYLWSNPEDQAVDVLKTPKIAVDSFVNIHLPQIELIYGFPLYQFVFRKKASA